mmetsp:Transcript_17616/g.37022  ORF Transcript_17616/g.37022 Transcript_17616/m.37022 type:complete len:316 (+) Transcript_17616:131-1078(+)|eukprot:CAMPEP_0171348070 /NCGR_PEP_ID=MMETSP0878-20121228/29793_1 /TAXON_ID=67004 /ORGANISM="Thalassiosira weissflogii, Strain CCMP1336" /LENGTH=315 /DNA_ID=CAMNT_0011852297 /DNA_START=89 /DNA_END=1036 /DNA_ORIENTATION=-
MTTSVQDAATATATATATAAPTSAATAPPAPPPTHPSPQTTATTNDPHPPINETNQSSDTAPSTAPFLSPAKKKLASLPLGDGSFETLMRQRSAHRKQNQEHSLAQLRVQLTAAERALAVESQRRIQATHSLRAECEERIREMEERFERILEERSARMEERLVGLTQKVEELTGRFEEDKERVPLEMERKGRELVEMMDAFRKELSEERSDRLSREGRIMKQMGDHSEWILGSIEKEAEAREEQARELSEKLSLQERQRRAKEEELQGQIQRELDELRGMIEREGRERKVEDEDIVMALNRYTQQMQSSLSVITS